MRFTSVGYSVDDGKSYGTDEDGQRREIEFDPIGVCYVLAPSEVWALEEQRLLEEAEKARRLALAKADRTTRLKTELLRLISNYESSNWQGTDYWAQTIQDHLANHFKEIV